MDAIATDHYVAYFCSPVCQYDFYAVVVFLDVGDLFVYLEK